MHAGTDFSSEREEGPGWLLRKHCLRTLVQESSGPPIRPYAPPLIPHFPTSLSKGMNVHTIVTVVLSIPNSQRPCAFCVYLTPPPHYSYVTAVVMLRDLPGAQLFRVDVSMGQFLPTALQQETKVTAPPAVCFLPMST